MPLLLLPPVFLVCGGWNGGSSDAGATLGVTRCNSYILVIGGISYLAIHEEEE